MKIGYQSQPLPVTLPCHLEGYQDRIAFKQHDELFIKTLYIKTEKPIIIHVIDAILVEQQLVDELKILIAKKCGFDKDSIFITAIHTHSAPKISHFLEPSIEPDSVFIDDIKRIIVENSYKVMEDFQEATVSLANATIEGLYSNRNGMDLPYHDQALILRFENSEKQSIVDVVNMACHPTILNGSNLEVSTDYVGALREKYYQQTGRELIFINGECGDVSTRLTRKGSGFDEVSRMANALSLQLTSVKMSEAFQLHKPNIKKICYEIHDRPQENLYYQNLKKNLLNAENEFTHDDQRLYMKEFFLKKLEDKMSIIEINKMAQAYVIEYNELRIITIPGEIVYQLAHRLRQIDDKPTIILAYTNDFLGYAVDDKQYGLYFETYMSLYPYGEAEKFINKIISVIRGRDNG